MPHGVPSRTTSAAPARTSPSLIRFQTEHDWTPSANAAADSMVAQMATVRLPRPAPNLSERLFARHRVEIPVGGTESDLLRLSVAAYTTRDEIDRR